jgi:hypothetical protein
MRGHFRFLRAASQPCRLVRLPPDAAVRLYATKRGAASRSCGVAEYAMARQWSRRGRWSATLRPSPTRLTFLAGPT